MTLLPLGCILLKMLSDIVVGRRFGEFAALCESRVGYIVAALTSPGADWRQRRESASFVAETVSRAFAWHGGETSNLSSPETSWTTR